MFLGFALRSFAGRLATLVDHCRDDYASWVDQTGYWKPQRVEYFMPLTAVISDGLRRGSWRAPGSDEQVIDAVAVGEDRFAVVDPGGEQEPEHQAEPELKADVAPSRPSANDAGQESAERFACPQAHLGCEYTGKTQRAVNAHQRFCEYREQP